MAIVFYISGHGFGHASRDVEVINRLRSPRGEPVVIRSSVDPRLLGRTITVPFDLRPGLCDTGIVQSSSITHEDEATVEAAVDFYGTFDARVAAEVAALADVDVELVVADIPPLAFATADALGVPSVALANFTWDWIYETHPGFLPQGRPILERIRQCYRGATIALELPFAGGFDVFPTVEPLPLVARHATRDRAFTRAHLGLPPDAQLALLSFGGYGLPSLDLSLVDCRGDWSIVTTDRVTAGQESLPHVHVVAEERFRDGIIRYEDLVAAVDVVVSKPGYGIIAECISTATPFVYTSRGIFREYDVLVEAATRLLRSAFISHGDLFAGRWRTTLDGVIAQPPPTSHLATNGADVAARRIDDLVENRRRRKDGV